MFRMEAIALLILQLVGIFDPLSRFLFVMLLDKTVYSHSASPYPSVQQCSRVPLIMTIDYQLERARHK